MPLLIKHTFSMLLALKNVRLQFDFANDKMVNGTKRGDPASGLLARNSPGLYKPIFSWFRSKARGGRALAERKLGIRMQ